MDATYGWGEDAELSMCLSKRAKLEMHPGVRGENLIRGVDIVTEDPRGIALGRARRYRRFALNHSTRRLDWFHYLFATIGVSAQAIAQGAPVEGIHIFVRETLYGIKQILSGPPYSV
jgi:hypothetical protein